MFEHQLRDQLASVGNRLGRLWLWKRLTWCWLVCTAVILTYFLIGSPSGMTIGLIAAASALVALLLWVRSKSLPLAKAEIARTVEQAFPELNSRLLAAIEQSPDVASGRLNVLQRQVISEALHHSRINDWTEAISPRRMRGAFVRQTAALLGFLAVCAYVWPAAAQRSAQSAQSPSPFKSGVDTEQPTIEPGDIEIERGTSLLVLARFPNQSPAKVRLMWRPANGEQLQIDLTKSLDDPVFAGRIPVVTQNADYRVDFDDRHTRDFHVAVYDLPALVRSDLELRFPEYTGLGTRRLEDAFVATVVEGTTISIACRLNKTGIQAKLVDKTGISLAMKPDAANPLIHVAEFVPTRHHRLQLQLTDDAGRTNRDPEEFRFEAKPNLPPEISLVFPAGDVKVSPLEEISIEASAWDDFGLIDAGIVVTVPGREPLTYSLGNDLKGGDKHKLSHVQRLEELKVEPDELISYYIYAEDYGPDGKPRRNTSDMFFAEVRPFEEIFRQIDSPPGGQSQSQSSKSEQNGNPTDKLLELQKQIVTATWKLVKPPQVKFAPSTQDNVKVIQDSQQKAIEQLDAMKERITAPQLQSILTTIGEKMAEADKLLGESATDSSLVPLTAANAAEQAAYQGLLKLRAKEHLMMKSQQQNGSGSGQSASVSKEQMEQLELDNKKNRYEMQKSGQKQADPSQREELAVLDRLKELARRQQGVNEKLKELEASLRTVKTEAEREELERQLKRLRDDQQQLLHDADEVRNKMTQSAQQEKMNQSREQLEQTRQRMVDTAEKLREGQLSQALNSGTRAERELQQLQEDFRKQTAARFADAMRSMRDSARQLAERERQLSEQLNATQDESKHSLRQTKNRQALESEFKEQRRQTGQLVDDAKNVVEQAEEAEPLLAKQLYDTVRTTRETKTDQALDATAQLLKAGFLPEAQRAEEQAREGINRLKQGIEKAAEAVLGDEVESLKRARAELTELSKELERELAQQNPNGQGQQSQGQPQQEDGSGKNPQGQNQQGQGQQGQNPGQQAQGQGQQGQNQEGPQGQNQPGQGQQPQGQQGTGQGQNQQRQPGQGQIPGQRQQGQEGQGQQGKGQQGEGQQGQGQQGQGQQGQGQQGQGSGRQQGGGLRGQGQQAGSQPSPGNPFSGSEEGGLGGGPGGQGGPLTGANFSDWNERLRDVESMVSDAKLQAEVAKVRERARSLRADFKRHSQTPNWDLVRTSVHEPMIELQRQLAEEIARREKPDSLVPVDRDPVPSQFRDLVRSYYERLGSGKDK